MARVSRPRGTFLRFQKGDSGIQAGDVVALHKTVGDTVVRAQANDINKMPAIGFAKRVSSSTVMVQVDAVAVLPDVVLTVGSTYWVSTTPGEITSTPVSVDALSATGGMIQTVGVTKKIPNKLLVFIDPTGMVII